MKKIKLTQGQYAIVDDWNYEWLSQRKWCAHWHKNTQSFYAERWNSRMHREILGLKKGDRRQADHINHNTLDNRECNLKIVNHQENQFNRRNTKGYHWHKQCKKYQARIIIDKKFISLGLFDTPEKAHEAYLKAKKKYHKN